LLPAGIQDTEREFRRGDMVDILDQQGSRIACGMTNYSARRSRPSRGTIQRHHVRLGYEYGAEVVHRNNLVVL